MDDMAVILDSLLIPEVGAFLGFLILFLFLWAVSKRTKEIKRAQALLELGHLEFYYRSSDMRNWRRRLINTDRSNMKDLKSGSAEVLDFFDRIGFLVDKKILPRKEVWESFALPIQGYFSFAVPYIQWLRTEERASELYLFFEDLNEAVFRFNRRISRKEAHPLMEEDELKRFIEEEKTALLD
jgi:hypothetical protein